MRVTIFGASGLLGNALKRQWTGDEVTGLNSKDADIRDPQRVTTAVERLRPEWIILAAAYTDVDGCETHPDLAMEVNCRGAVNVAEAASRFGARLLFLSTDYVFDGNKSSPYEANDVRSPQNAYGRSKADAEVQLIKILPDCCILRTSWLFGVGGKCFPDTILKLAAERREIDVVNDQRGCPTYNRDLARALIELCRRQATSIVHVTNSGECTWFEFAEQIGRSAGLATMVHPIGSDRMPRPARRPAYSVLSSKSLSRYQISMPDWKDALKRYLGERNPPV
jgi:dTDP-4-dehydrorhamnose reductase